MQNAIKRLHKELSAIEREPIDDIIVKPSDNMLEWYFIIQGSKETPYEGGFYAGKVIFPADYPWKAPDFVMLSPSGRFEVGKKICLSFSSYHQETWNPMWTVSTMLRGLVSFMNTDEITTGMVRTTTEEKLLIAKDSKRLILEIPQIASLFTDLKFE